MRVNTISAGPLGSRAAKAIGFIDDMIRWALRLLCVLCFGRWFVAGRGAERCMAAASARLPSLTPRVSLPPRLQPPPAARSYSYENAPVQKELHAGEVGAVAAFLVSPLASAGARPLACWAMGVGWAASGDGHAYVGALKRIARSLHPHPFAPSPPLCCAAVTGQTVYVDNGLSIMGLATDSKTLERKE